MEKLTRYLRWYVHDRITHVPAWQKINVILSDSSAPGEGEHKIMEFVRLMRTRPGYNPNWRHVIHGLDADLIMLALATHEAHFFILRELVTFGRKPPPNNRRGKNNNNAGAAHKKQGEFGEHNDAGPTGVIRKPLQFVRISTLREYFDW